MLHKVLFIRCRESVEPDIFSLVEEQLRNLAGESIKCETLDIISLNYKGTSYFQQIFDKERVHYAGEIVRKKKPDIVVSGNDVAITATIIKVCNLLKIPSVVIQHGILAERKTKDVLDFLRFRNYLLWRIVSSIANIPAISKGTLSLGWRTRVLDWGIGGATKYAVMGNYQKRHLISQGVPPHKIVVTGYPLFDLVPKRIATFNRRATFRKLGINEDQRLVLFTTQCFVEDGFWRPRQRRLLTQAVIDSAKNIGLQLIIKVHPREDATDYERLSKSSEEVIVLKNFDLHELLLASDVAVTVSSTTGLWALAYGKPLIIVACFPTTSYNFYKGASFEVDRPEDLSNKLRHIIEERGNMQSFLKKKNMFLRDHAYKLDSQASRRIAKVILSFVEN